MRHIDGHILTREKVANILVDNVNRGAVRELGIECGPATGGWFSRREDSLQDKLISEGLRNLHLKGEEFNDGDGHSCSIIINRMLFFQIVDVFNLDGREANNPFGIPEDLGSIRRRSNCWWGRSGRWPVG